MTILPIEDYQITSMSRDELQSLWLEIQEEADRLDEILADEERWADERKLAAWCEANAYDKGVSPTSQ